jgi:hypothetical protein
LLADNGEELLDADDLTKASTAPPRAFVSFRFESPFSPSSFASRLPAPGCLKMTSPSSGDDCEVSKDGSRRACKNCTCGRADGEEQQPPPLTGPVPASSCGNVSFIFPRQAFSPGSSLFLSRQLCLSPIIG